MRRILAGLLLLLATSAQAQIVGTLPFNFTNGTTADATQVMANYNFIASQTNANAATAGANSNITALLGLTNPIGQGAGGSSVYMAGSSAGTANAQTISSGVVPSGFNLVNRPHVVFTAGITNTGAATLAINGTAATAIVKSTSNGPKPLTGGEIVIGNLVEVVYDGTNYNLITPYIGLTGAQSTLTTAATVDLGTSPTHNVLLSGAGTITSFGSSASVEFPIYYLVVGTSGVVLTSGANLIVPGGASVTFSAGDSLILRYNGAGVWVVSFMSVPIVDLAQQPLVGNTGSVVAPPAGKTRLYASNTSGAPTWQNAFGETESGSGVIMHQSVSGMTSANIPVPTDAGDVDIYVSSINSSAVLSIRMNNVSTASYQSVGYSVVSGVAAINVSGQTQGLITEFGSIVNGAAHIHCFDNVSAITTHVCKVDFVGNTSTSAVSVNTTTYLNSGASPITSIQLTTNSATTFSAVISAYKGLIP